MVRRDKVIQEIFVGSMWELTEDIFGSHGLPIQVHMYAILIYYYYDGKCHLVEISGDLESNQFLPCADCLKKHCQRESYHRKFGA